jgi:hypothetical protein
MLYCIFLTKYYYDDELRRMRQARRAAHEKFLQNVCRKTLKEKAIYKKPGLDMRII